MRKQLGAILGIALMFTACKKAETPGADTLVATSKAARISARAAQQVPVTTSGIVGITTGVPVLYTAQWAFQQTEYGFFWLDTSMLVGGHVQAISKCVGGFPPSNSALYVLGDCNSIAQVVSSVARGYAQVISTSGQCGAQTRGCGGPRSDGHWLFNFNLGGWEYNDGGDDALQANNPPNQQADPSGQTWQIRPTDGTNRNFAWTVIGTGPTPPPVTITITPPTQPTVTPTRPTPPPPATATPCVNLAFGRVGSFGQCYDCENNVVAGDPCGRPFGAPCCAPGTPTGGPTSPPSQTPTLPPPTFTANPSGTPTPCVVRSGDGSLVIIGPCG